LLRYDLGLTGTKIGCNEANAGSAPSWWTACRRFVHLPGAAGQRYKRDTIEGLEHNGALDAFSAILSLTARYSAASARRPDHEARALLNGNPTPTRAI